MRVLLNLLSIASLLVSVTYVRVRVTPIRLSIW